jgi:hypothetical protein
MIKPSPNTKKQNHQLFSKTNPETKPTIPPINHQKPQSPVQEPTSKTTPIPKKNIQPNLNIKPNNNNNQHNPITNN